MCTTEEINTIINSIHNHFKVNAFAEITLEANPDDLTLNKIKDFSKTKINRLSIGIQSFFNTDLKFMNRAHNADEAYNCIIESKKYFSNLSIDLIYGTPGMSDKQWEENLQKALSFKIPHISSYALTVEPNTALEKQIQKGITLPVNNNTAKNQYTILVNTLEKAGYINYEFSNFGKEGFFSQNNTAYWQGKKYLGIGPSAHSFDGKKRSWNIANNSLYLKNIEKNTRLFEIEKLSINNQYNEYIMTGLRTIWGVSMNKIEKDFGKTYYDYLIKTSRKYIETNLLIIKKNELHLTKKGKFLGDGIASDLFFLN